MKKKIFMLSCIAAVAIATFVGKKTFESNAFESDALLVQNVEALSSGVDGADGTEPETGYNTVTTKKGSTILYCGGCVYVDGTDAPLSGTDKCNP